MTGRRMYAGLALALAVLATSSAISSAVADERRSAIAMAATALSCLLTALLMLLRSQRRRRPADPAEPGSRRIASRS